MPAHVGERPNRFFSIPHNHDRDVAQKRRKEIPNARYLSSVPDILPRAMKDLLFLGLKHIGLDIPSRRQSIPALKSPRDTRIGGNVCRHLSS
jgi:hypothetical protein